MFLREVVPVMEQELHHTAGSLLGAAAAHAYCRSCSLHGAPCKRHSPIDRHPFLVDKVAFLRKKTAEWVCQLMSTIHTSSHGKLASNRLTHSHGTSLYTLHDPFCSIYLLSFPLPTCSAEQVHATSRYQIHILFALRWCVRQKVGRRAF